MARTCNPELPERQMAAYGRPAALDHARSLVYALNMAMCPIAPFAGNFAAADRVVPMLLDLPVR